jgi:hypothetical protein
VLLVEPDFADEKGGVEDEPGDDGREYETAEKKRNNFAKREHHPSHVEGNGQRHQTHAEGNEECDDALAARGYGHGAMIARSW